MPLHHSFKKLLSSVKGDNSGGEDPLAALRRFDTVILVDDSSSMDMFWKETENALKKVVEKAIIYDGDGIDLYFLNNRAVPKNVNSVDKVAKIFKDIEPCGLTPTARAVSRILDPYLDSLKDAKASGDCIPKPMNLIVLTDGAPDNELELEDVLVKCGKRLDDMKMSLSQLGVNFIQIGNNNGASTHLAHLDDGLKNKHRIRDFVDTTPYEATNGDGVTGEFILKALLGGINRRVDKGPE